MTWINFLEPLRSARASVTGDKNRYYMSDCGTEGRRVNMYIVQCRVIVDNRCEFQHSSSHGDCNFDARQVRKTRKDQRTNNSETCLDDLRSSTQGNKKKEDTCTSRRM